MIGSFKISAIGTAHLENPDGVCQDYSDVLKLENGYTIAVIADGLGSASKSDIGAKVAVNSVLDYIKSHIATKKSDKFYINLISQAYREAYTSVMNTAKDMRIDFLEFNTTLTAAIYDGKTLYYGQCGDGGIIVLTPSGSFDCATEVKKGEAFNETFPLLGGSENWSFGKYPGEVCALTLMTDGIYDIVCHPLIANEEQKINIPFIRRFMDRNILKANNETDFIDLQKSISKFISGNGLPNVTDDKTIVGLINTDIMADLKDDKYYDEPDWDKLNKNMKRKLREGCKNSISLKNNSNNIKESINKITANNNELDKLKKRLHNSYNINKKLRKIILIQMIMILACLVICTICIVSLIKHNNHDTSKKNMNTSSISQQSIHSNEHTQESSVMDNNTISDNTNDFTQSHNIESRPENTDITNAADTNSNADNEYNSNITEDVGSEF